VASFPQQSPAAQRRLLAEKLLNQLRYFGNREDALPEWREAARIRDHEELWRVWPTLPIIDKAMLQTRFSPDELRRFKLVGQEGSTGGSTGEPTRYFHDTSMLRTNIAIQTYTRLRMGWSPGMSTIIVWGSERDIGRASKPRDRINNRLLGDFMIDGYHLTDDTVDRVVQIIRQRRPVAIYGFTSMLEFVAERVLARGLSVGSGSVRTAWCGGEMLFREQSDMFCKALGVPILNRYGGRELSTMACQFDTEGPLEVLRPWLFLEIVDDCGRQVPPGNPGRLLWTSTVCRGTPFLRYDIGDLGSSDSSLETEAGVTAIRELHGRIASLLTLPDGRKINNAFWNHLFKDFPEVQQFQVIVRREGGLRFLLRGSGFAETRQIQLKRILNGFLGPIATEVQWVEKIPLTSQGKRLQVIRERSAG
jgi:phenylacetate-CoA ligase